MLRPAGPLPASVYWLRRAAVLLVVVVVVAVVVIVAGRGGSSDHTSTLRPSTPPTVAGTPTASTSSARTTAASTAPSATSSAAAPTSSAPASASPSPVACDTASLTTTVTASARNYDRGVDPTFIATLSSAGGTCTAAGGLTLVVSSGSDRIWGSSDCDAGSDRSPDLAGGSISAGRRWDRTRTAPGCGHVSGDTVAAPGTYRVVATWGGVSSAPAVFTLR